MAISPQMSPRPSSAIGECVGPITYGVSAGDYHHLAPGSAFVHYDGTGRGCGAP